MLKRRKDLDAFIPVKAIPKGMSNDEAARHKLGYFTKCYSMKRGEIVLSKGKDPVNGEFLFVFGSRSVPTWEEVQSARKLLMPPGLEFATIFPNKDGQEIEAQNSVKLWQYPPPSFLHRNQFLSWLNANGYVGAAVAWINETKAEY